MKKLPLMLVLSVILTSCSSQEYDTSMNTYINIPGRDLEAATGERPLIYRAKIPKDWIYVIPDHKSSISDTMKSIADCYIREDNAEVRIAIHNFPTHSLKDRIPPSAQVSRWKEQFEVLERANVEVIPQSFAGYAGFRFDGEGIIEGEDKRVLGWAMQLGTENSLSLEIPHEGLSETHRHQMRSDFTIKAMGSPFLIAKYRDTIIHFANSFELIDEIPSQ